MKKSLIAFTILLAAALPVMPASADTVHVGGGLKFDEVQVLGIDGNQITFTNRRGGQSSRELSQVTRLEIDTEPAFNEAETAYAAGDWEKATAAYEKTVQSTNKEWLKQWASLRLFETADKSGNFPAAVTAYIQLLRSNPQAATGRQPRLPDATSTFLDTAAKDIEAVLNEKLEDAQRAELLKFLLDIHQHKGDTAGALSAAERLGKLTTDAVTPENRRLIANLKLGLAKIALEQKDYQKAIDEIDANRAVFTEPEQQAEALYVLAAGMHQLAGEDQTKLQDAAVAYVRVVAHFPKSPHAGEALLRTGSILETLGQDDQALAIYQQAANEYPATGAKAQVERLQNGG